MLFKSEMRFPSDAIDDSLCADNMRELIEQLNRGENLDTPAIKHAVAALLDPAREDGGKADFLAALRAKGETAAEIAGFVTALLAHGVDPGIDSASLPGPMLDVCGTGGDRAGLFNISSTVMFLLAAGGAVVVKHGNRGITSKSGGADVLEALGVQIELPPEPLRECVAETGLGFIFAPAYHPAFRVIGPVRKQLAERGEASIFNILGPLLNPARPPFQLAGIYSESLLPKYADVLALLGRQRAWAVHGAGAPGAGGLDELSTLGINQCREVLGGSARAFTLDPEALGFPRADIADLRGGGRDDNAKILTGILSGEINGPKRDVVVLNAAAAFVVCGLAPGIGEGIALAHEALDSGKALAKLQALRAFSQKYGAGK
jgi:anthranilate phosphoribosyltransferase